jgi:hypothetical protein
MLAVIAVAFVVIFVMAVIVFAMIFVFATVMAVIFVAVVVMRHVTSVIVVAVVVMRYVTSVIVATVVVMRYVTSVIVATVVVMRYVTSVNIVVVIFCSGMVLMAFLIPLMGAVRDFMPMIFMLPDIMMFRVVVDRVRMVIFVAVDPGALPGRVIDKNNAAVPGDSVVAPAPGTE